MMRDEMQDEIEMQGEIAAAQVAEAGKAAPQLLAVALQDGPRGPEVSNLQTDSAELFYAVSSK